ncbi:MAG TPA: tripartite tricarboxylate transporter substrate-binding protein [Candidatus Binatia bacterium]|nr:tripartite tricarboxylate transporter substrate-binding protein [Candidatus Binatia bacterium]
MKRMAVCFSLLAPFLASSASRVLAQTNFYEAKTVRIIVGLAAGGGYDVYARTIARHMGKHIPGNPVVTVENMTGAGSLVAANHLYKVAKPDGLTMAHFIGGLFLHQLLGKPGIEFDAPRFEFVGTPMQDNFVIGIAKSTGITDVEKWFATRQVVKIGGIASGTGSDDVPNILKATIGLPLQLVSGYRGTSEIRLAFNSGEVSGVSISWESAKSTWRKEVESGEMIIMLQANTRSHPELTKVPVSINFARTDEAKKLMQMVLQAHGPAVRPFVLPPHTPNDRVQILRKAFMETMKDPQFLAETKKANLDINPSDGASLEQSVKELLKSDPALVAKLKEILK